MITVKQLFFFALCLGFFQGAHAAAAKTLAEKRAHYCQTLGVPENASLKLIKETYRKIALGNHPDKNKEKSENERREADAKFQAAAEAHAFLVDPENRELSEAEKKAKEEAEIKKSMFVKLIIIPFLDRCDRVQDLAKQIKAEEAARVEDLKAKVDEQQEVKTIDEMELEQIQKTLENQRDQFINDFLQACQEVLRDAPSRFTWRIENLRKKVRNQGHVEPEDEAELKNLRQQIEQVKRYDNFMARLDAARNCAWCAHDNRHNLHDLWMRVFSKNITDQDEQELRNLEAAVAQDKIDHEAADAFGASYQALVQQYNLLDRDSAAYYRLQNLFWKVRNQGRVTDDDRDVFNQEEAALFFQTCQNEMTPCGNSTEHYSALDELMTDVRRKNRVDNADKANLEKIRQQKNANFRQQCFNLHRESSANSNAAHREETARFTSKFEYNPQTPLTAEDQRNFTRLHTRVQADIQRTKNWERLHLFASFAAPIVFAFLHGYVNNKLARNAGALQQVPFYRAPLREWGTGYFALCWQLGLGVNLFNTLSSKYYRAHSVSKEKKILATLAYLASIGIFQNLGERIPANGKGWRGPINSGGSMLLNTVLANSSLCAASSGLLGYGLKTLLRM